MGGLHRLQLRIYWLGGSSSKDAGKRSYLLLVTGSPVFTLTKGLILSSVLNYAFENAGGDGGCVSVVC